MWYAVDINNVFPCGIADDFPCGMSDDLTCSELLLVFVNKSGNNLNVQGICSHFPCVFHVLKCIYTVGTLYYCELIECTLVNNSCVYCTVS